MFLTALYLFICLIIPGISMNTIILGATVTVDIFSWICMAFAVMFAAPEKVVHIHKRCHK